MIVRSIARDGVITRVSFTPGEWGDRITVNTCLGVGLRLGIRAREPGKREMGVCI